MGIPEGDPSNLTIRSIDYRNYLRNSNAPSEVEVNPTDLRLNQKESGFTYSKDSGLMMTDWSKDMETWLRLETKRVQDGDLAEFEVPGNSGSKALLRGEFKKSRE